MPGGLILNIFDKLEEDDQQLDVDNPEVETDDYVDSVPETVAEQTPDEPDFTQDEGVFDDQDNTPGEDSGGDYKLVASMSAQTAANVAATLHWFAAQVGYREGGDNANKYAAIAGHANHEPWCATFVCAGLKTEHVPLEVNSAYCPSLEAGFHAAGRLGKNPRVGAVFFLYFTSLGRVAHCGIVEKVNDDGTVTTLEGNTNDNGSSNGNGVYRRRRSAHRGSGTGISAYGYPEYSVAKPAPAKPDANHKSVDVVKKMQKAVHVPADGIWGPQTEKALRAVLGYTHISVKYLQARVGTKVDGAWGPKSYTARKDTIKTLQKLMEKLTVDGVVGDKTKARFAQYEKAYYKK